MSSRGVVISRNDDAGFPIGQMPSITEVQFNWLSHRMGLDTDLMTCVVCDVDPETLDLWKESPDFLFAYEKCTSNKREAFKYLITQLNGKALRVINNLLDEPSVTSRINAVSLLMRAQALLMDKQKTVELDDLTRLINAMRETTPLQAVSSRRRLRAGH